MPRRSVVLALLLLATAACGGGDEDVADTTESAAVSTVAASTPTTVTETGDEQRFPDVVGVEATSDGDTWTFSVTISSPYDTPDRYADAWRVVGPDGTVYGERPLAHDHQFEQPFTRSLSGVEIPDDVDTVTVEGRDQRYGWGGGTMEYQLPPT